MAYPGSVARCAPRRAAMVLAETGETATYDELDERSARLAAGLRARGLADGDAVAILLVNDVRWGEVCWACWRSGLVLAAVNHHLGVRDLAPVLADAAPRAVVTTAELLPGTVAALGESASGVVWLVVGEVPESAPPGTMRLDDLVADTPRDPSLPERAGGRLLFSSGTTGRPKPFLVAPRQVHPDEVGVRSAGLMRALGFSEPGEGPDVLLVPGPAHHAGPIGFLQSVHQAGGTVVLMRRFDAEGALAAIERYGVTHSQWVPTMFVRLLRLPAEVRDRHDLSSHRVAVHAAAPCPPAVKQAVLDWWGPIVHEYYGASEGYGRTVIGPREWLAHPGSVGRAVGSGVSIADDDGRPLPPGEVGTVWFTSPGAAEPERAPGGGADLAATPGWGTVGDLGHLDEDGYLYLTGRASQTIITGGVNVHPREVELLLGEHPDVDDVAVVGLPDEEYGERVVAVVVPRPGAGPDVPDRLVAWARERIAHVTCPREVHLVAELPRNDAGKVLHRELVDRLAPRPGGS